MRERNALNCEFYNDKLCIWEKDECRVGEKIRHQKKSREIGSDTCYMYINASATSLE